MKLAFSSKSKSVMIFLLILGLVLFAVAQTDPIFTPPTATPVCGEPFSLQWTLPDETTGEGYLVISLDGTEVETISVPDLTVDEITLPKWLHTGSEFAISLFSGSPEDTDSELLGLAIDIVVAEDDVCELGFVCSTGSEDTTFVACPSAAPSASDLVSQLNEPVTTTPWDLLDLDITKDDLKCAEHNDVKISLKNQVCSIVDATGAFVADLPTGGQSCTAPTDPVFPADVQLTGVCEGSCPAVCDGTLACSLTFDTISFPFEGSECPPVVDCCALTLEAAEGSTAPVSCGDSVAVTWKFGQGVVLPASATVQLTGQGSTDVLFTAQVDLSKESEETKLTFVVPSAVTSIVATLVELHVTSEPLNLRAGGQCQAPVWLCDQDLLTSEEAMTDFCPKPTAAYLASLLDSKLSDDESFPWSYPSDTQKECGSTYELTPKEKSCLVSSLDGTVHVPVADLLCAGIESPSVSFTLECEAKCSPKVCGVPCVATVGDVSLPSFDNCSTMSEPPTDSCDCSVAFKPIEDVECGATVEVTWVFGPEDEERTPVQNLSLLCADGTEVSTFDDVALASGSYSFTLPPNITCKDLTVEFADADGAGEFHISNFPCVEDVDPVLSCVDSDQKAIACDQITETLCADVCGDDYEVPRDLLGCFVGSVSVDISECAAQPSPKIKCTCQVACGKKADESPILCDDAWVVSTECGVPDSRDIDEIFLVSEAGTKVDCLEDTPQCLIPAVRVTAANVELCYATDPTVQCSTDLGAKWGACEADFEVCPAKPTLDDHCGVDFTRQTSCAVVTGSNDDSKTVRLPATIDLEAIAALFGVKAAEINLGTETESEQVLADFEQKCEAATTSVPHTRKCDCFPALYCWVDVKESSTTPPLVGLPPADDAVLDLCSESPKQTDFNCPLRCSNESAGNSDPVDVDRVVFCLEADGSLKAIKADEECGTGGDAITLKEADVTFPCEAQIECIAQLYCQAFTGTDEITDATGLNVEGSVEYQAPGSTEMLGQVTGLCTETNFFSASLCFKTEASGAFPFQPDTCTIGTQSFVRRAQCIVHTTDGEHTQVGSTAFGTMCQDPELAPVFTQDGCSDFSGCSPSVTDIVVSLGTVSEDRFEIDLNSSEDPFVFKFEMLYRGPLADAAGKKHNVAIQFGTQINAEQTPAQINIWSPITTLETSDSELSYTWSVPTDNSLFNFALTGTLEDHITVVVRLFVVGETDISYPLTLTVLRNLTCAANPGLFVGSNVTCTDEDGVATAGCDNGAVYDAENTTGPCSRTDTCNTKTPACANEGFYLATTTGQCQDECTCVNGFSPASSCESCIQCPTTRGVAQAAGSSACGCATCNAGFKNGPNDVTCSECSISTLLHISPASTALLQAVGSSPTTSQSAEFKVFANEIRNFFATELSFPIGQIAINAADATTQGSSVSIKVVFTGDCVALAERKAAESKFVELAQSTSAPLTTVVDGFDGVVLADLSALPTFSSYAYSSTGTPQPLSSTPDFEAPELTIVPVQPDKKKKKTNVAAIVAPVVICGVLLIAILVVIFCICFRGDESGSQSDSDSDSPKAAKSSKRVPQTDDADTHLELV